VCCDRHTKVYTIREIMKRIYLSDMESNIPKTNNERIKIMEVVDNNDKLLFTIVEMNEFVYVSV
jgi:hypothetical protein